MSSGGSTKGLAARREELPRIPCETGSALFAAEGTYLGRMVMLFGITEAAMCHKESLQGTFCDLPLSYAPFTPVLSP